MSNDLFVFKKRVVVQAACSTEGAAGHHELFKTGQQPGVLLTQLVSWRARSWFRADGLGALGFTARGLGFRGILGLRLREA